MNYSMLLAFHLIGAAALFALFTGAIFSVLKNRTKLYTPLFIAILGSSIVQLVSGAFLYFTAGSTMSATQFCARLGGYVIMSVIIESVLFFAIKAEQRNEEAALRLSEKR
jgi:hypothetical protein